MLPARLAGQGFVPRAWLDVLYRSGQLLHYQAHVCQLVHIWLHLPAVVLLWAGHWWCPKAEEAAGRTGMQGIIEMSFHVAFTAQD